MFYTVTGFSSRRKEKIMKQSLTNQIYLNLIQSGGIVVHPDQFSSTSDINSVTKNKVKKVLQDEKN